MFALRCCFRNRPNIFLFSAAKAKKQKTFYQILEVPTTATPTSIKKNYFKLAKIYHPDVYKGADKNRFQKIQQAYKTLSNQGERINYDQKIGIRVKTQYTQTNTETQEGTKSQETYGKQQNDFNYNTKPKVEINIDEEYEKFFKKKSHTHVQEIRLHEQNEFKAMSEVERVRRRFRQVYGNLNWEWKMDNSKSYTQILDDQINQKNRYEQEGKQKKQEYQRKYTEEGIRFRTRMIKIGAVVVLLAMMPFIFSFKTKLRLERQAKQQIQSKIDEIMTEMQTKEIRSRLRFD